MTSTTRAPDPPFSSDADPCKDYGPYRWGQGETPPFCEVGHQADGEFAPVRYRAVAGTAAYYSACKGSAQNA